MIAKYDSACPFFMSTHSHMSIYLLSHSRILNGRCFVLALWRLSIRKSLCLIRLMGTPSVCQLTYHLAGKYLISLAFQSLVHILIYCETRQSTLPNWRNALTSLPWIWRSRTPGLWDTESELLRQANQRPNDELKLYFASGGTCAISFRITLGYLKGNLN